LNGNVIELKNSLTFFPLDVMLRLTRFKTRTCTLRYSMYVFIGNNSLLLSSNS